MGQRWESSINLNIMDENNNLFILGCGRSGTSLVAGLFRNSGLFLGSNFYQARDSNPLGFFEDREVNLINEQILKPYLPKRIVYNGINYGSDSALEGQRWLARISLDTIIEATEEIEIRIKKLTSNQPFCFKDPRFSYTIDVWRPHINNAKYICIFRDPAIVVASILKEVGNVPYLQDFAISIEQAFDVWRLMYQHILTKHSKSGEWLFLHYDDLFRANTLDKVEEFTGAKIDRDFPNINLNRSRPELKTNDQTSNIYHELLNRAKW